jgi:hypothetical protein
MGLRKISTDGVLDRVEQALAVRLEPDTVVRKRRSVGFRTDRATWVRIEVRDISRTTFNTSLDTLAAATTIRIATPSLKVITQERMTATIQDVFPDIDTTVGEWVPAHADLGWANLTAPTCYILDWEDWGMAPRGWDAATLWSSSLAVPTLANRLVEERAADFGSRVGKLAQLFHCAGLIAAPTGYAGPLLEPAQAAAAELLTSLR